MLAELAARKEKLAKTETKAPKKVEKLLCEDSETYNKLMSETFMEEYYAEIEEFSFGSVFFELSTEIATTIHAAYSEWSIEKDSSKIQVVYEKYPILQEFALQIDEKVKSLKTAPYFFIRLSTRSPKDAVLHSPKFENIYLSSLAKVQSSNDKNSTKDNDSLVALYEALTLTMRNECGSDAIKLLITSQRIQGDLETYAMGKGAGGSFQVILRDWFDFEVYNEFRAFIYQKKITSITQYNEYCYFPHLHANKEEIGEIMKQKVQHCILPKITKLENLVLDLILCKDSDGKWTVKVVEINPLAEFAGTGLFTWEEDRKTLLGAVPFEFRIQKSVPSSAMQNLPPVWHNFIQQQNNNLVDTDIH